MSMVSLGNLKQFQEELKAKFGADENIGYAGVSMTQFSIARYYGGITINGKYFVYNPADDSLIRDDVVKWIVKQKKVSQA